MRCDARVLLLASLMLGLSACKPQGPAADNVPTADAASAASPAPANAAPAEAATVPPAAPSDVSFSVEPGVVYACDGRDRTTSVVKWNVSRPGVNTVKVLVSGPEAPEKKTLAVMSAVGEAKTGNWITQGVLVELTNNETGEVLASHTIQALPCQ